MIQSSGTSISSSGMDGVDTEEGTLRDLEVFPSSQDPRGRFDGVELDW